MLIQTRQRSASRLVLATLATITFCVLTAFVIVYGETSVSGLPSDISAIQQAN